MKVLVISDTHGHHKDLEEVLEKIGPIDMLIHLGDLEDGEDYIEIIAGCETHMVSGNNDFFSELQKESEFLLGKYRVFITHGHYYSVSLGLNRIKQEAISRGADIVMFGHTHKPYLHIMDEVTLLNPGSISYPRQEGRRPSFMILELDKNGEIHYTQNFM